MSDFWLGAFAVLMTVSLVKVPLVAYFTMTNSVHEFTHQDTLVRLFLTVLFGVLAVLTYTEVIL